MVELLANGKSLQMNQHPLLPWRGFEHEACGNESDFRWNEDHHLHFMTVLRDQESRQVTSSVVDDDTGRISLVIVNTKEYHLRWLWQNHKDMRRTLVNSL
ncbi:hypothetical protein Tco_1407557 [Tanacetum coccineum]